MILPFPTRIVQTKDVQKRRFASTGWSHDGNKFTLVYREVDLLKNVIKTALQFITFLNVL
jgi:hypothetical protein